MDVICNGKKLFFLLISLSVLSHLMLDDDISWEDATHRLHIF